MRASKPASARCSTVLARRGPPGWWIGPANVVTILSGPISDRQREEPVVTLEDSTPTTSIPRVGRKIGVATCFVEIAKSRADRRSWSSMNDFTRCTQSSQKRASLTPPPAAQNAFHENTPVRKKYTRRPANSFVNTHFRSCF